MRIAVATHTHAGKYTFWRWKKKCGCENVEIVSKVLGGHTVEFAWMQRILSFNLIWYLNHTQTHSWNLSCIRCTNEIIIKCYILLSMWKWRRTNQIIMWKRARYNTRTHHITIDSKKTLDKSTNEIFIKKQSPNKWKTEKNPKTKHYEELVRCKKW